MTDWTISPHSRHLGGSRGFTKRYWSARVSAREAAARGHGSRPRATILPSGGFV